MDLATVMSIVQTLLTLIQTSDHFKVIFSKFSSKSELETLQQTLTTILSVLEDAEAKQDGLNSQEKNYIQKLKDAVFDADDVLDEFLTLVHTNKITTLDANDKFHGKVKSFFSQFKPVAFKLSEKLQNIKLSKKVHEVSKKLEGIAKSSQYSFKVDYIPRKFRKEDTSCFFADDDKIIGREDDVDKVISMLLDKRDDDKHVRFVSIVGMGGLGKTALAQLVFHDPRLKDVSFDIKSWTCIGDQEQQEWNLTEILLKVLKDLPTSNKSVKMTSLQQVQDELKKQLDGKKYLFVLDDVWTERYDRWEDLAKFLTLGQRGSRVIVTTRSKKTARMIAESRVHELQGLSENRSWDLFRRMALPTDHLEEIGRDITKNLSGVPLAIRVVASLLRDQSRSKWEAFQENGVRNIRESENDITHILKLSYYQLEPRLRSCFAYCALFPKDHEIGKNLLIMLWMAQGYIHNYDNGEEYFLILLQRCFFQNIYTNKFEEIYGCKVHDLWHDIAEQAASTQICKVDSNTINVGETVRHLSLLDGGSYTKEISNNAHQLRTFHLCWRHWGNEELQLSKLLANWSCLRTLTLTGHEAESLPNSIGGLLHLRYLDLTKNDKLEALPNSITKLYNLQSLILKECTSLRDWPKDMSKLVNISTLDVTRCDGLRHMPSGLGKLTGLHTLGKYIVGQRSSSEGLCFSCLQDLKVLNNLRGFLELQIEVEKGAKYSKEEDGGGGYLRDKQHLSSISFDFGLREGCGSIEEEESLLEELQPHSNCKHLNVIGYSGVRMPRWQSICNNGGNSSLNLPNLVILKITECMELRVCLPSLWKLPCLRELELYNLPKVEYLLSDYPRVAGMSVLPSLEILKIHYLPELKGWWPGWEDNPSFQFYLPNLVCLDIESCMELRCLPSLWKLPCLENINLDTLPKVEYLMNEKPEAEESSNFPSLENLHIQRLTELKGWCPRKVLDGEPYDEFVWTSSSPCFPVLKKLIIEDCPKMTSFPVTVCPLLEEFSVSDSNRLLGWRSSTSTSKRSSSSPAPSHGKTLHTSCIGRLKSIPIEKIEPLLEMILFVEENIESFKDARDFFTTNISSVSSLRSLEFYNCPKLRNLSGMFDLFTALERLVISKCPNVDLGSIPWRHLPRSFHHLELSDLLLMVELPEEMQYCTALDYLQIDGCKRFVSLPKWLPKLTLLRNLKLKDCLQELEERCRDPDGENWPLIQHIPHRSIFASPFYSYVSSDWE